MTSVVLAETLNTNSFSADLEPVFASIYPGEVGTYSLVINNKQDSSSRFQIATIDPNWILNTIPALGSIPQGTKEFQLEIQPVSSITYGPKIFELRLNNIDSGELVTFNVPINIRNPNEIVGVYVPSVQLELDMEREIDPREQFVLSIDLINRNNRNLDPLMVYIEGDLLNKQFQTSIAGLKQRSQEIQFNIDPLTEPKSYKTKVKVVYENKTISEKERSFRVVGYNIPSETTDKSLRLLDITFSYTVFNDGNQELTYDYSHDINWFSRLFLSAEQDFTVAKIDGERKATINQVLNPQESRTINFTIHWNYLILIILAIVLSLLGYYKLRNPVLSMKEILLESADKNISEAKIRIFVRNRSNKTLNNMRIVDKLSGIADLVQSDRLGTLQPSKITKTKNKGTLLKWEIAALEPYEERIITYKIKSKLEIIGGLSLPATKIIFEEKEGKERSAFSNEAKL